MINLGWNQLKSLPDGLFHGCESLERVHLLSNQLTSLPDKLFNDCKALKSINLESNQLSSIQGELFNQCKALEIIDLKSNQLFSLPSELFDGCESLENVYLGSNQLTLLPDGIFNDLKNVRSIDLSKNGLVVLPAEAFKGFSKLLYISFYENKLSSMPADLFSGCNSLTKVCLGYNQITSIPPGLFKDCTECLTEIFLRKNRITSIPAGLFNECKNLLTIDLAYNKISSIPADLFADCCELESIDLSCNRIRELSDNAFNGCHNLTSLLLENNSIKSVSFRALEPLENCVEINITNNFFYNSNSIYMNVFRKEKSNFGKLYHDFFYDVSKEYFIVRGGDEKAIERFFISFFLSSSSKNFDSIQSLKNEFKRWIDNEFTFLDLLISVFGEIDDRKVTNLTIYVNELMKKNPLLGNKEFLIKSEKSLEKLCRRNVFSHFQAFLPNTFHQLISLVQKTDLNAAKFKLKEEDFFRDFRKYVAIKKYPLKAILHHIDYMECFNIALNNKNCEIAKFVIILLRYYFLVWDFRFFWVNDYCREECFKKAQKVVNEFNRNLCAKYEYIFKNDLTEIIVFLLDIKKLDSLKRKHKDKSTNIEEITNFIDFDLENLLHKDNEIVDDLKDNKHFLEFVQQNDQLLKHEAVKEIIMEKWRAEAALKYYFDLFWFIVYVAFFTVYIECKGNTNVEPKLLLSAKYISLILALVNLILEVFQCMLHIVNFKFLQYIQR